jgi:hypothetical protein
MRATVLAALGAALLAGCTLTLDPDSVEPPAGPRCVPTGCAGKACGYVDCGTTCLPGSGCLTTHSARGSIVGGAARTAAAAGHAAAGGVAPGAPVAAPSGHFVVGGTLSN